MRRALLLAAVAVAVTLAGAAWTGMARAQEPPPVASARAAGIVGERFDGYVGFAVAAPEAVRRQVETINIRRRKLYIELARRRGVAAAEVGITAGCSLLARVAEGGAYMLADGRWRRRSAGEEIRPSYCTGA